MVVQNSAKARSWKTKATEQDPQQNDWLEEKTNTKCKNSQGSSKGTPSSYYTGGKNKKAESQSPRRKRKGGPQEKAIDSEKRGARSKNLPTPTKKDQGGGKKKKGKRKNICLGGVNCQTEPCLSWGPWKIKKGSRIFVQSGPREKNPSEISRVKEVEGLLKPDKESARKKKHECTTKIDEVRGAKIGLSMPEW